MPPLLSDIDLSVDDRYLYASCWGTGEMRQYEVSDPFDPKFVGSVRIGGVDFDLATLSAPQPVIPDEARSA